MIYRYMINGILTWEAVQQFDHMTGRFNDDEPNDLYLYADLDCRNERLVVMFADICRERFANFHLCIKGRLKGKAAALAVLASSLSFAEEAWVTPFEFDRDALQPMLDYSGLSGCIDLNRLLEGQTYEHITGPEAKTVFGMVGDLTRDDEDWLEIFEICKRRGESFSFMDCKQAPYPHGELEDFADFTVRTISASTDGRPGPHGSGDNVTPLTRPRSSDD
ncbi:hypothetical protein [Rhizobium sp. EC-SD404]|uniref:hypothetical protein n=1 Tax=Rhizobium sp. EC-SD404 TaxID=2038389 RepID=UPI0012579975|nr:hypothetical protein [Rhizobium sp. EC-SD404]VVT31944.1 hypothetical protein RHIZ404_230439 [Rhizobium sp. EC-SD404]